ncbi:MAG: ABC transporter ATP-binding protein [Pseudomonadota bacterium]
MAETALLRARNISKSFAATRAVDDVSITLHEGEIVALLGENGAGKSTLVKLIFGALQPDAGYFKWRDQRVVLKDPATARALGIGMVHQHFSLFEAFTATQNVALGLPDAPLQGLAERTAAVSATYGLPLDPHAIVADLSVGERQRIEIVRCLLQDPTLIIMDEPTSVLTPQEAERLFATLRRLRGEGRTILYISHKLEEVRALCERAIVMRAGRVVSEVDPRQTSASALAEAMVGGAVADVEPAAAPQMTKVRLEIRNLSQVSDQPFGTSLSDVSLTVSAGEVLGIAGMAGNGQSEFFACLSGETLCEGAAIRIDGEPVGDAGIDERRARGAAFIPEERFGHSAVPSFDLVDNVILSRHLRTDETVAAGGFLKRDKARAALARVVAAMDVRAPPGPAPAGTFSGGNLQKFVVGRELDRSPSLLVVNQPTWGVDAGAAANIRQAIVDLAAAGGAVLVMSQDLDELFQIATRLAVISGGRLSTARPTSSVTRSDVGLLMAGSSLHETQARTNHAADALLAH